MFEILAKRWFLDGNFTFTVSTCNLLLTCKCSKYHWRKQHFQAFTNMSHFWKLATNLVVPVQICICVGVISCDGASKGGIIKSGDSLYCRASVACRGNRASKLTARSIECSGGQSCMYHQSLDIGVNAQEEILCDGVQSCGWVSIQICVHYTNSKMA